MKYCRALIFLFLPIIAACGDSDDTGFTSLREAVAQHDRDAAQQWLEQQSTEESEDPLELLANHPTNPTLEEQASRLFADELQAHILAFSWVQTGNEQTRSDLLIRLDQIIGQRKTLTETAHTVQQRAAPATFVFDQLFTAGSGQEGKLAEPSDHFSVSEPTIHLRFSYQNGSPGETLTARWLLLTDQGPQEFASSSVKLQQAADRGQFSFSPEGGAWRAGFYRVEILGRDQLLATHEFAVGNPEIAVLPAQREAPPTNQTPTLSQDQTVQQPALHFTQMFTAGAGREGRLAEPSNHFPVTEPAVHLRYLYEHGTPGETLTARWLYVTDQGAQEFAHSSVKLQQAADRGQFSFTPESGQWQPGFYRVEILGRDQLLATHDFSVGSQTTSNQEEMGQTSQDETQEGTADTATEVVHPVTVMKATLAKSILKSGPKGKTNKFTTARRSINLWAKFKAPSGGRVSVFWYLKGRKKSIKSSSLNLPRGISEAAFWLKLKTPEETFPPGRGRVDIYSNKKLIKRLRFTIKKVGFLETIKESAEQAGDGIQGIFEKLERK